MEEMFELLDRDRCKWISIVKSMGCPSGYEEDVIQDAYIKICTMRNPKKIMYNEREVNYYYVVMTLRSVLYDLFKSNSRYSDNPAPESIDEKYDSEKDDALSRLYEAVIKSTNEFGRYGSKLTQMYFKTDLSLREISDMSEISLTSIFNSIKGYKNELIEKHGEDYIDYINGDYDKV